MEKRKRKQQQPAELYKLIHELGKITKASRQQQEARQGEGTKLKLSQTSLLLCVRQPGAWKGKHQPEKRK